MSRPASTLAHRTLGAESPAGPCTASSGAANTLADLGVGAEAVVEAVGGDRLLARRLMELGLLPGTRVRVVRAAPLGDPIEIRLRGSALSIRRAEARSVRLRAP